MKHQAKKATQQKKAKNKIEILSQETFKLRCEKCSHEWELGHEGIQEKQLEKGIEWRFFSCPECRVKYTTFIGNKKSENMILRRAEIRDHLKKLVTKTDPLAQQKYNALLLEDSKLQNDIAKLSAKLKKEVDIEKLEQAELLPSFR